MIRGTTPVHRYKLPLDRLMIKELRVIYAQNSEPVLVKTLEAFAISDDWASVKLTQEESLLFDSGQLAEVQMRILTTGGEALASKIKRVSVGRLLEDEVME